MRQQGFCESGCIKILLLGQILPTIFYAVNFLRIVCNVQDAWQAVPLCPYGSAISIDVVTVFDASITGNLDIHFRGPVNAVYSVQGVALLGWLLPSSGMEPRTLTSSPQLVRYSILNISVILY